MLAVTLGAFVIVPPFVSVWMTGRRMKAHSGPSVSSGQWPTVLRTAHIPIISLYAPVYLQRELNKVWRAVDATR